MSQRYQQQQQQNFDYNPSNQSQYAPASYSNQMDFNNKMNGGWYNAPHNNIETNVPPTYSQFQGDMQFQPPVYQDQSSFTQDGGANTTTGDDIDQKIMENIQKYLSQMLINNGAQMPQVQRSQSPPQSQLNNSGYYHHSQTQQYAPVRTLTPPKHLQSLNTLNNSSYSPYNTTTNNSNLLYQKQQQQPSPTPQFQHLNATFQQHQDSFQQHTRQTSNHFGSSPIKSYSQQQQTEEYSQLRQVIEGLTKKVEGMQFSTTTLQKIIDDKERELQRMKSIHQIRLGQSKPGQWDALGTLRSKKKVDKAVQTPQTHLFPQKQELITQGYLNDIDQDLLKSEKTALLHYMRKEVVQNQEFLNRISELEGLLGQSNEDQYRLREHIEGLQNHIQNMGSEIEDLKIQQERQIQDIREQYEQQLQSSDKSSEMEESEQIMTAIKVDLQDQQNDCQILTIDQFYELEREKESLISQNQILEQKLLQFQSQLDSKQSEIQYIKTQLTTQQSESEEQLLALQTKASSLEEQLDQAKEQILQLNAKIQQATLDNEKKLSDNKDAHQQEIKNLKLSLDGHYTKLVQERDALLRQRDLDISALRQELDTKGRVLADIEAAQKTKKKIECVQCLKKDGEIQNMQQRIAKMTQDMGDIDRQVKGKDAQIANQEGFIKQLSIQLSQASVGGGGAPGKSDPNDRILIEKLQKELNEKTKQNDSLVQKMAQQAQQYVEAMMQQQNTMPSPQIPRKK